MIKHCLSCGTTPEVCSFCPSVARHWLAGNVLVEPTTVYLNVGGIGRAGNPHRAPATIYFCDDHVERLLSQECQDGETAPELAMYTPNEDCSDCDSWR